MRRHDRINQGLTLIEIMVAITIAAMAASLVWSGLGQSVRNKKGLEERAEFYQELRVTLERMSKELSMAFVSAQLNPNPTLQRQRTAFVGKDSGDNDRINFTSFSHQRLYRDANESDQNEISYFIADHPDKRGVQVLARREDPILDDDPTKGGDIEILAEGVTELNFEYLDPRDLQWRKEWNTTQALGQPNLLPLQVKVSFTIKDPRKKGEELTLGTRATPYVTYGLNHAVYQ